MLRSPQLLTRVRSPDEWGRMPRRRRNLLRKTADFNDAVWLGYWLKPSLTTGHLAPDGTNTAWAWMADATVSGPSANSGGLFQEIGGPLGQTYTASCWFRASSAVSIMFGVDDGISTVSINLTTGWQRFSRTGPTSGNPCRGIQFNDAVNTAGLQIFFWGPQCELGGQATAYQRID